MHHPHPSGTVNAWMTVPGFLIRSTGFPFEWLEKLQMAKSQQRIAVLLQAEAQVDRLQAEFEAAVFPQLLDQEQQNDADTAVFRQWYKLNRRVRKKQVCPAPLQQRLSQRQPHIGPWLQTWADALQTAADCAEAFDEQFEADLQQVRASLYEMSQNGRFQEAVLLSNPTIYTTALPSYLRHYQPDQRPSKVKYLERQLYAYVQRFCTKNDTTSFFGPIDYGWCDSEAAAPLILERQAQMPRQRLTRLAYWAVQALADAIAADPAVQPYLIPRLEDGIARRPDNTLYLTAQNRILRLPPAVIPALQAIDGRSCLQTICEGIGAEQWQQLRPLLDKGLVTLSLKIPTAVFDPAAWLLAWLDDLPAACATRATWQEQVIRFQQQAADFTHAEAAAKRDILKKLERSFSELTQQAARRGEGTIYADRLLLYDEAQGDILTCTVGQPLNHQLLTQLGPALDLCVSYSLQVQAVCRQKAWAVFQTMAAGAPVPYLAFVRQLNQTVSLETCLADAAVQAYVQRLERLAQASQGADGVIRLKMTDLPPFLYPIPPGTLVSPDLFLGAPDPEAICAGEYQLTIGEIHYGAQVWCHFLTFCQQQPQLAAALTAMLPPAPGYQRAAMVYDRHQGKTFYLELPGLSVEVRGRSVKTADQMLPVSQLMVVGREDKLAVCVGDQLLELYPGDPRSIANWIFGTPPVITPPIHLGHHTPRILVEDVILERAAWRLPTADWLPERQLHGADLMLHLNRLREHHQLPRQGFVRLPQERKPFYIDFANQLSLEFFLSMIKDKPAFTLTELLPSESHWWLKGTHGTRSCEWRMTMIYGTK